MASQPATDPSSAVDLYASWRHEHDQGRGVPFEDFCRAHATYSAELRRIHANYGPLGSMLGLESSPGRASKEPAPFSELIARLERRRPAESRYRDGAEIGHGGMGEVVEAFDVDLRRSVARKRIRGAGEGAIPDASTLGRFIEEAQVTAQLSHPGIVPVHELGVDEKGRVYFTMDRVPGKNLGDLFEHVRNAEPDWPLARIVGLLERVCETVAYAHSRRVLHRDLKPSNVMVGEFGEVYVMDWGLAKVMNSPSSSVPAQSGAGDPTSSRPPVSTDRIDESDRVDVTSIATREGTAAGTPGYMAPEQAEGKLDELDPRTDVYSLGAILYEFLTGRLPYHAAAARYRNDRGAAYLAAMAAGDPPAIETFYPDVPAELASICRRAMARDRRKRYPSAKEMADDLRRWLQGRVVLAHEQGAWAELRKWVMRNRALAASLGVALLALLGAAATFVVMEQGRIETQKHDQRAREVELAQTELTFLKAKAQGVLWPALPRTLPGIQDWKRRSNKLLGVLPYLRSALAAKKGEPSEFKRDELAATEGDLRQMIDTLEAGMPLMEWVDEREQLAQNIESLTSTGPEAKLRWQEAQSDIADSSVYQHLRLAKQEGLLPLRKDPKSGLWEFWHALSGARPTLDQKTGRWVISEDMGIVLVLIPGGDYELGSPEVPETDPRFDFYRGYNKSKPLQHRVHLDPYFLSKYELTQAQWLRATHEEPSQGKIWEKTHPVESISQVDAIRVLARFDLVLPTEAQWEVGARGGAETVYSTGKDPKSMVGSVVLAPADDAQGKLSSNLALWGTPWKERHEIVGERLPNGYGLHDVHGNVWEWCLDKFSESAVPRSGDGLRTPDGETIQGTLRGGGWKSTFFDSRLAHRLPWDVNNKDGDAGVRPARPVR